MRRTKALAALASGAMLVSLAACGGDDGPGEGSGEGGFQDADETIDKDPTAQGPAPEVEGAQEGGTITVYHPDDAGPEDLDPTNGWSVTGNSIQQALTHRSLTQYRRDAESGEMILVPDLAVDLGTPNEDFTEWTFTIRDDATWETGETITAEEVAWGIERSFDSETFPSGPGTEYTKHFFEGAEEYEGPYSDPKAAESFEGITFDEDARTVTIKMATSFPDMDYWGAFMAMGPAPLGKASDPPAYGTMPLSTGPYKVESFRPSEELVLVRNEEWIPESDPARHQYADKWIFKFSADPTQTDELMLSGNTESETSMSASITSENYENFRNELGDRLVQQSAQCTSFWAPDYTKIDDINVRKALAYAYDYESAWTASGEVPGVTRVPANSIMPPGMVGKSDYQVDGEQITFDPDKAKELLAEAGFEDGYDIHMAYNTGSPTTEAAQQQLKRGLEESGFTVTEYPVPIETSLYTIWTDPENKTNKKLNLRGVNWCSDWPSGLTMLPSLLRTGATYNTAFFSEEEMDAEFERIPTLPVEDQPAAWGELDERIATEYYPIIPTAFRNDLFAFGAKIGNPTGDGALGAPNYKELFVAP
ncbi:ABC transporter substrate-binding protein [Nocardioides bizhenqiangii]|uniref:ABC transporter substrate-binding protein n=1 Tax=Nocardioides bizhenqiangii TaxID=3095076 RepID=A0ABZ0ZW75_9ACTN|nr:MULTISPECIES: ABC transporter substrate-binding protein [unclassified Nocardioides]MDZ5622210.1 ABC transporter substrate-binding protein [Nocardioides sp. HM23]WQQ28612.1 ABC transporter substrate-binding protein [Nocardioides sp. HM61]